MLPSTNIQSIIGATLFGADDTKIGRITTVLVDAADGHPTFAEVHTGFLGHATRLVPLDDARWERDDVYVSYSAALVKDAPRHEAADGVSPEQEDELRRHYAGTAPDARDDDSRGPGVAPARGHHNDERDGRHGDADRDRNHDSAGAGDRRDGVEPHGHRDNDGSGTERRAADGERRDAVADGYDRDRDRDGDGTASGEHADVPPVPDIEEGQVLREERLVVRREEVPVEDGSEPRHVAPPGDAPRI